MQDEQMGQTGLGFTVELWALMSEPHGSSTSASPQIANVPIMRDCFWRIDNLHTMVVIHFAMPIVDGSEDLEEMSHVSSTQVRFPVEAPCEISRAECLDDAVSAYPSFQEVIAVQLTAAVHRGGKDGLCVCEAREVHCHDCVR